MKNILFISGSLGLESVNTKLLKAFESALPDSVSSSWGDIDLPLFNKDLEVEFPEKAQELREAILSADVIIISTPEHNRGMPGVLKNAIDWA